MACFWGTPSSISLLMLLEIVSPSVPVFIGMVRYVGVLQCFQRIMERMDWANSWYSALLLTLGPLDLAFPRGFVPYVFLTVSLINLVGIFAAWSCRV